MNVEELPKLAQNYLENMKKMKGKQQSSVDTYGCNLNSFFKYIVVQRKWKTDIKDLTDEQIIKMKEEVKNIDVTQIKKINSATVKKYMLYCENKGDVSSTRISKIIILRNFFEYLIKRLKIQMENPMDDIDSPKTNKRLPKPITPSQAEALLNIVDGENKVRDLAIIRIFLDCGLRVSEMSLIDLNHINEDELRVIGKGDKERMVYLSDNCLDTINEYLKIRPMGDYSNALFISRLTGRLSIEGIQLMIKTYLTRIGAGDKSVHSLRHTFACTKLAQGVDIRTLQEMMGHESIETTAKYLKVTDETKKKAFKMSS